MTKKILLFFLLFIFINSSRCFAQVVNLLNNGNFETGNLNEWTLSGSGSISSNSHSGSSAFRSTGGGITQRFSVQGGKTYGVTFWYKVNSPTTCSGDCWGGFNICLDNWGGAFCTGTFINPNQVAKGQWFKGSFTFTAVNNTGNLYVGKRGGSGWNMDIVVDDIALFDKTTNQNPAVNPTASVSSGTVPLTVNFRTNGDDPDGAIKLYRWEFGDGAEDNIENPSHTFIKGGNYQVKLTVWDNDGASVFSTLSINVDDSIDPSVIISSPTNSGTYSTTQSGVVLSGSAQGNGVNIPSMFWDNLSSGAAKNISITPSGNVSWTTESIALKPGKNEILITAVNGNGNVGTDTIVVNRNVSAPVISNIDAVSNSVAVYEKYELSFNLETVADNPFFRYEVNSPAGIQPEIGVTAEAIFTAPSGKTLKQPAFFMTETTKNGSVYSQTNNRRWTVRFSPQETGQYTVSLRVQDKSGTITTNGGTFTATAAVKKGFIKVSKNDTRYFEYSNGDLFFPIGPAWGDNYSQYANTGTNLERPWMAGRGVYSTNWARWISSAEQQGNEGYMSRLNFKEHYPGHDLSREIFYPQGFRVWISRWGDDLFHEYLKPNTNYQYKIRFKTQNIAGPRDSAYPFGFAIKLSGFLTTGSTPDQADSALRSSTVVMPHIKVNRDWHTITGTFTTPTSSDSYNYSNFNLFLDNVTGGQVYIDEFSVKEILTGGSLGGEIVRQSRADMHTYFEQRPAAYFDDKNTEGEKNGVFFKYVVMDKNDWIPNHLSSYGIFTDYGSGYSQEAGTKARWLQEQWWRYLIARWGYSTAVHSWELCNEADPNYVGNYRHTQDFAQFMHQNDSHPHLATTSFWCCWKPELWGNNTSYPDVDYADIHKYTNLDKFGDDSLVAYDMARFQAEDSLNFASSKVGKPIIRGETGIGDPWSGDQRTTIYNYLTNSNPGIWYHNLLWAQLNSGGMSEFNYWWDRHFYQDTQNKTNPLFDRLAISKSFFNFVKDLDINKGGYTDLSSSTTNSNLRVYGQKNLTKGKAHFWIQNKLHTWRNVMGVENPISITPQSGTITTILNPNTQYQVDYWNTYQGTISKSESKTSDSQGKLDLIIQGLTDDLAVKITSQGGGTSYPADLDNNGHVDKADALVFFTNWYKTVSAAEGDLNNDGKVNSLDFAFVLKDWGK